MLLEFLLYITFKMLLKNIKYVLRILVIDITFLGSLSFFLFLSFFMFLLDYNHFSYKIIISLVISYILVGIIRFIYYKPRPNKQKYSNLLEKLDSSSFPSLHAMRISILFVLFMLNFNIFLAVFFFLISIIVCYSRIYLKKHYLIDIIFGYLIGLIIGYLINILF